MDPSNIHFLLDLTINQGKSGELESIIKAMNDATALEPGALAYEWYLSKDGVHCRLFETYADAAAVQAHLSGTAVQQYVPKMLGLCTLDRFEVYGIPDAESAAALEGFGAKIFRHWKGISLQGASAAR